MKGITSATSSGVRKGAWTKIEDDLLKACVQLYGEGKWHLVPQRAGLNRCRKSCRLRWLNYLKPNIKRGDFSEDEVDLMLRLHKLLGNRWSLIAGRLPGRTSNDVKNYWNTYIRRKVQHGHNKDKNIVKLKETESTMEQPPHQVIKPVPRALSQTTSLLQRKLISNSKVGVTYEAAPATSSNWWETLLLDYDKEECNALINNNTCFFGEQDNNINGVLDLWDDNLTSIACDFPTQGETWRNFLLELED